MPKGMGRFKPLTEPMPGISFNIWRIYIHCNFAKTLTWAADSMGLDGDTVRRTEFVAVCMIEKNGLKAFSVVIGPIKIMIGFVV